MTKPGRSRVVVVTAALLLACAVLVLLRELAQNPGSTPGSEPRTLRIIGIEDGDTGELESGEFVRYIGIDAPEEEDLFWYEATRLNGQLCLGKEVRLEYGSRKMDRYGRVLAYVYVDDTIMVNEKLIDAGLAVVYIFPEDQMNPEYRERLIGAQRDARANRKGIWSLPPPEPTESVYLGNPRSYRFHRPSCRTLRESNRGNLIESETRDDFLDSGFSPCRICKP